MNTDIRFTRASSSMKLTCRSHKCPHWFFCQIMRCLNSRGGESKSQDKSYVVFRSVGAIKSTPNFSCSAQIKTVHRSHFGYVLRWIQHRGKKMQLGACIDVKMAIFGGYP